jgi:hypothetical protein
VFWIHVSDRGLLSWEGFCGYFRPAVPKLCQATAPVTSMNSSTVPLPYPIKIILQNSGLHNPLRKIITIKFGNYFTVSKLMMRLMGLMKWYQFPNVWSTVTTIVNKRTMSSEGPTSSFLCLILSSYPHWSNPTALQRVVQLTLGTTAIGSLRKC